MTAWITIPPPGRRLRRIHTGAEMAQSKGPANAHCRPFLAERCAIGSSLPRRAFRQGIRPRLISSDPARKSSIVSIG
jgi:hypothetical protein